MTQMTVTASAAEKMNGIYRRQRFIYDATRRYYLFGRDRLIEGLAPPARGAVLEIGCGTARNLIRAARLYPDARFYGLDVSEAMLRSARSSVGRRGLAARIVLREGDAAAFDLRQLFALDGFDRVFISYALSMIPAWRDVVRHAGACLAPGGKLFIVDFGDFDGYPALLRRIQLAWLRHFSVVPIPAMDRKIGMLAEQMGFTAASEKLYGGYAVQLCLQHR
jgi:S-adenosylmethionine-diacylgycerolhomoserine-N-methlytransferase